MFGILELIWLVIVGEKHVLHNLVVWIDIILFVEGIMHLCNAGGIYFQELGIGNKNRLTSSFYIIRSHYFYVFQHHNN